MVRPGETLVGSFVTGYLLMFLSTKLRDLAGVKETRLVRVVTLSTVSTFRSIMAPKCHSLDTGLRLLDDATVKRRRGLFA